MVGWKRYTYTIYLLLFEFFALKLLEIDTHIDQAYNLFLAFLGLALA
jgi:hypothetical protein